MKIILYDWIDHLNFKNEELIRAIHSTIVSYMLNLYGLIFMTFNVEKLE
jgi:hypothetical protein